MRSRTIAVAAFGVALLVGGARASLALADGDGGQTADTKITQATTQSIPERQNDDTSVGQVRLVVDGSVANGPLVDGTVVAHLGTGQRPGECGRTEHSYGISVHARPEDESARVDFVVDHDTCELVARFEK
ncbi:MAG: hypothetical protein JWM89_3034 [Acidimicrobiales bacterium]|nr:hypothetical protein [Acidimicrobiales bacterium]